MRTTYSKDEAKRKTQQRRGWTDDETREVVDLYNRFLDCQERGEKYQKKSQVAALAKRLGRSHGSVEAKLMNVSGVRHAEGMTIVQGYRPLKRFQRSMRALVLGALVVLSTVVPSLLPWSGLQSGAVHASPLVSVERPTRVADLFAGVGGWSTGAAAAGCDVVWAGDIFAPAMEWHAANHPLTQHVVADLTDYDWNTVPPVDLVLASPSCQGHSDARGAEKERHAASRDTAWIVCDALETLQPRWALVENVVEMSRWSRWGEWCDRLQSAGYTLTTYVLDVADFGVPQNRERMVVVAGRDGEVSLDLTTLPHVGIRSYIDWDRETPARWSRVDKRGRAQATLDRVARGRVDLGVDRFVAPFYGSGSGATGRDADRPLGTVTCKDRWMAVDGDECRMLSVAEYAAAQGFPSDYRWPPSPKRLGVHLAGNAVSPKLAQAVIEALLEVRS